PPATSVIHALSLHDALPISGFSSFVSVFSSASVYGLLKSVISKNTENHRYIIFNIKVFDALGNSFTNKVKMFGFSLYHTSDSNNSINFLSFNHSFATVNQLKTSGNFPLNNIIFMNSIVNKSF